MPAMLSTRKYGDGKMWGRDDFCPERPAYDEGCEELLRVVTGGSERRVVLVRVHDTFESRLLLWDEEANGHVFSSWEYPNQREAIEAIHGLMEVPFEPTSWGYDLSPSQQAERDKASAFLAKLGYAEFSPKLIHSVYDHPNYKTLEKKWISLDKKVFSGRLQDLDAASHQLSAYCYRALIPILNITLAEFIGRAHLLGRERMTLSRVSKFCAGGQRILEVGCGEGLTSTWIAAGQPKARVLAVDQFSKAVALTRAKARTLRLSNLHAQVADVFALAADKTTQGSFDRIVLRHVIGQSAVTHDFRPSLKRQLIKRLRQLRSLLAPHGRLFFALSMKSLAVKWVTASLTDCLEESGYSFHSFKATPFRYQDWFEPYSHLELIAAHD